MVQSKIAFLFPGQGSQSVGMGKDLFDTFSEAKAVFQEVDDTLHQKLSSLMFDGDIKELTQTQNTQPAIMTVSMALVAVLKKAGFDLKNSIQYMAGHSLGEYSALCASGALTLSQTANILRARGKAMAEAGKSQAGGMLAILGAEPQIVTEIAHQSGCFIANDNGGGQLVLSGTLSSLTSAKIQIENTRAKRTIFLPVAGAFHSPLMQSAQETMIPLLKALSFQEPFVPLIMNVTAEPEQNPKNFADLLIQQIVSPVRWRESILYMQSQGITHFVECGPGMVLSGLVRRIFPDSTQTHINDIASLQAFLESF